MSTNLEKNTIALKHLSVLNRILCSYTFLIKKLFIYYFYINMSNFDKSTPISNLNLNDESPVVEKILKKFDNLQQTNSLDQLEKDFENRNITNEVYNHTVDNEAYKEHQEKEHRRVNQNRNVEPEYEEVYYEEVEEEYTENNNMFLKEIRPIIFVFIICIIIFNNSFNKLLMKNVSIFFNEYKECNILGLLFKSFLVAIIVYLLLKFFKF